MLKLTTSCPNNWNQSCITHRNTIHHSSWHSVLHQSFKTTTLYIWDTSTNDGISITIFKKLFFKIGYIGFPLGSTIKGRKIDAPLISKISTLVKKHNVQLLRISSGEFSETGDLSNRSAVCPETYIAELNTWCIENLSKRCRRDINKSIRENCDVQTARDPSLSHQIYYLYAETIKKNQGTKRYNLDYFSSLIKSSFTNRNIRVTYLNEGDRLIAFLIILINGTCAHYLHGAINYHYRKKQPNDLLIYDAILWSKRNGAESFNFMSSPSNQPNLVKFKEKWGAKTSDNTTYDIDISTCASRLFRATTKSISIMNKYIG